jgi:branched-chain amino acid transport system permease protein
MEYFIHLAIMVAIYSILSLSLNLVVGYTGLLSVTQAAFYGIGAYTTAILATSLGVNFFWSIIIGIGVAMAISLFIGLVLSRFKDDYYALASLGFNVITFSILLNWSKLTRGPLGIPGIPRPAIFGFHFTSNLYFLLLVMTILIVVYLLTYFIVNSSFGRALKGIREHEKALAIFGYNTRIFKMVIFIISAGIAAIAGSIFASYITFIDPSSFTLNESIFILSIVILGGLADLRGSILGAIILILLPEILRFVGFPDDLAANLRQATYGLMLIILMFLKPQGLLGKYKL